MKNILILITGTVILFYGGILKAENPHLHSNYAGQENRQIKSLSESDVIQLKNGQGWGLAKAAELNGMPGPKHILEMKKEIELTEDQELKIQKLFENMNRDARELGNKFISLEKDLNDSFTSGDINENSLKKKLKNIAVVQSELRFIHLNAHIKASKVLTHSQIVRYNQLRGYSNDPCSSIPPGHDPEMWKKHNGCN